MFTPDTYEDWRGIEVVDQAGGRIGTVLEVMLDTDTDRPEWLVVEVEQTAAGSDEQPSAVARLVPLAGLAFGEAALVSRWTIELVAASPIDGAVDGISRVDEDVLYRYYELDYPTHWVNDGMPGGAETIGIAGIATEGRHPTGSPSRSLEGPASAHEVDEPRRIRPAHVVDSDPPGTDGV